MCKIEGQQVKVGYTQNWDVSFGLFPFAPKVRLKVETEDDNIIPFVASTEYRVEEEISIFIFNKNLQ